MTIVEHAMTLATALAVAWVASRAAIAIRFARTKAKAQGAVDRTFISFLSRAATAVLGGFLAWQFVRSAPLTRLDLLFILLAAFGLFFHFVTSWLQSILGLMDRLSQIVEQSKR